MLQTLCGYVELGGGLPSPRVSPSGAKSWKISSPISPPKSIRDSYLSNKSASPKSQSSSPKSARSRLVKSSPLPGKQWDSEPTLIMDSQITNLIESHPWYYWPLCQTPRWGTLYGAFALEGSPWLLGGAYSVEDSSITVEPKSSELVRAGGSLPREASRYV